MDSAQYERVKQLFETCRELPPSERAALLRRDAGDSEVEREVAALLDAYDRSTDFLEKPALAEHAGIVARAMHQPRTLAAGARLGPYEIIGPLAAGGMGEVYRARDTRLRREVAIKILPDVVANDPARRARFEAEARAVAALNHPNIAALYAVEEDAMVMELVHGPTLEEYATKGPVPLPEAFAIARQIADALESAHERGIVHRDLKPANIKLTEGGIPKLLDFGLAKAAEEDSAAGGVFSSGDSPALTQPGMILGTAGYMAPEQAAGKAVDKRADIWAFGVVFYEMICGKRLFQGETAAHTMADVLRAEIDWDRLPSRTPHAVRTLLRRCLERDLKKRLRDIGEARILLDRLSAGELPADETPAGRGGVPLWAAAIPTVAALALGIFSWRALSPSARPLVRLKVELAANAVRGTNVSTVISPDGTRIVFPVSEESGTILLATRLLGESKVSVLGGTEGAVDPFFSPDGQWIGFFGLKKLKKVSVRGGSPVTLCSYSGEPRGGAWGEDGYIIANLDNSRLARIPENGGNPEMLAAQPRDYGEQTWRWPQILPDQRVLFTGSRGSGAGAGYEDANIDVLSLKTGKVSVVHRGGYYGRYVPSGHLIYVHQGALFAVPFDLRELRTRGAPVPILDDVAGAVETGAGQFDFAAAPNGAGTFVYLNRTFSTRPRTLVWMNSAGRTEPLEMPGSLILPEERLGSRLALMTPRLSPDGKLLAFSSAGNIQLYDLGRKTVQPLTRNGLLNNSPVWAPDGKHLLYSQQGGGESAIWWVRIDQPEEPRKLYTTQVGLHLGSLSREGWLAFAMQDADTGYDLWTLRLDLTDPDRPKAGTPEIFLREPSNQDYPAISPDGRWIAFSSSLAGPTELYVRPFPAAASSGPTQVSTSGGRFPIWSKNGRELFFASRDNRVVAVTYQAKAGFISSLPVSWSPPPILNTGVYWDFDLAPDGKRIVTFPAPPLPQNQENSPLHATFLLNFFDELSRKAR